MTRILYFTPILRSGLMAILAWYICIVLPWKSKIVPILAKVYMPSIKSNMGSSSTMTISGRAENILELENAGNSSSKLPKCVVLNVQFEVCQVLAVYLFSFGMFFSYDFVIKTRLSSEPLSSRNLHRV